jgi:hypothetical protein
MLPISHERHSNTKCSSENNESELESIRNINNLVENLMKDSCEIISLKNNNNSILMNNVSQEDSDQQKRLYQEENLFKMCKKLTVLAVAHLKEGSVMKETLFRCQFSDDYLGPIINECFNTGE